MKRDACVLWFLGHVSQLRGDSDGQFRTQGGIEAGEPLYGAHDRRRYMARLARLPPVRGAGAQPFPARLGSRIRPGSRRSQPHRPLYLDKTRRGDGLRGTANNSSTALSLPDRDPGRRPDIPRTHVQGDTHRQRALARRQHGKAEQTTRSLCYLRARPPARPTPCRTGPHTTVDG